MSDEQQSIAAEQPSVPGFVMVPSMLTGAMAVDAFQQQLYHWAFEQAKQATQILPPVPVRDLFSVMN